MRLSFEKTSPPISQTEEGWDPSGYLALDAPLILWLQYKWCPYDLNELQYSWHDNDSTDKKHY